MRRIMITALAALMLGAAACGGPEGEEFTTADSAALRQLDADFVAAYNAKDIDKLVTLYAENSVFMPPNKPLLRGKDTLKPSMPTCLPGPDRSEDGAGGRRRARADCLPERNVPLGSGPTYDRGKFLFVMRKMGGKWLYQHTMWSSDLPRPGG